MAAHWAWRTQPVGKWALTVHITALWTTGALLVFYLLHVIEKFHTIPWMLIEMVLCLLWSFFYLTAAIDTAVKASWTTFYYNYTGREWRASEVSGLELAVTAGFGFAAMGVYGCDAILKFTGWRAGQLAQGERAV